MTFYSLVLFAHITAVLGLFATLSIEVLSLFHLRRASTLTEARRWLEPVPGLPLMASISLLVILLSGVYLAMRMSAFNLAWTKITVGAILIIAPFGALTSRRMRAVRRVCGDTTTINSELLGRFQDPFLKISLGIRIAVFLGIVLLMAAKPGLWQSVSIIGSSVVFGLLSSLLAWRRNASLPAHSADLEKLR
jgi:hypothetical protein